ncbi:MAG TPA: DUF4270 family protein [Bacteroidales bacterium]|nr:DUF4270 family protein [Bacteroidales bacterium]HOU95224.1 DUF4270 family protein [Bacteroidales bacterium]HQG52945.1 DUF4270 family protein [Bacteroidales bacterium]HRC88562.1 DUF4270 family protein [Bacteroidales bacterium]
MTNFYQETQNFSHRTSCKFFNYFISGIIFIFLISLSSCSEKAIIAGIELLPDSDFFKISSTDTINVESFTEYRDSVPAMNKTYSYLGGLYDPYFGSVSSDFVAQLRLTEKWPSGGVSFTVDSVQLYIHIEGAKGQIGIDQTISLYEISEKLSSDSIYYSTRDPHIINDLGTYPLPVIEKDTIQDLIINLPASLGEYLTRDTTRLIQGNIENDFRSFFKGIYVTVSESISQEGKGIISGGPRLLILSFDRDSYYIPFVITVFYHTALTSNLSYSFIINNNSVRYNRYYHDFSTAQPEKRIKHINDGYKDTLSYLQSFYGVYTKIRFPGLSSFRDSMPVSVNKARITIPVYIDGDIYQSSSIPSFIFLVYKNSEGYTYIVPDYYMSTKFYNGSLNTTTLKFTFNIASFTQYYLEGKIPEPELTLSLSDVEYRNIILKANNNFSPVKFEITYTRY